MSNENYGRPAAAPQPTRRHSNIDDGRTKDDDSGRGYPGNFLFKPTCEPQRLAFPEKDKKTGRADPTQPAVNTFRLLPEPDPGTPGKFRPAREYDSYGQPVRNGYFERYMVARVRGMGPKAKTAVFAVYDPDAHIGEDGNQVKFDYPMHRLMVGIKKAGDANKGEVYWQKLVAKDNRDALKYPNWTYLAFGLIYNRGPKENYDPPLGLEPRGKAPILDLGMHVGNQVRSILSLAKPEHAFRFEEGHHDPEVPVSKLFEVGNPVSLDGGVFFRAFGKESLDPRRAERYVVEDARTGRLKMTVDEFGDPKPVLRKDAPLFWDPDPDAAKGDFGYDVYACKSFVDNQGRVISPKIDKARYGESLWKRLQTPIHDHLIFLPAEEQAALIAKTLTQLDGKYCVDLLEYAWDGHQDWIDAIPDEVRREFAGRVTVQGGYDDRRAVRDGLAPQGPARGYADPAVPGMPGRPAPVVTAAAEDDDEEVDEDEAAAKAPARGARPTPPPAATPPWDGGDDEEADEDDNPVAPAPEVTAVAEGDDEEESEEEEDAEEAAEVTPPPILDDEDEAEEDAPAAPAPPPRPAPAPRGRAPKADKAVQDFDPPPAPERPAAPAKVKGADAIKALAEAARKKPAPAEKAR